MSPSRFYSPFIGNQQHPRAPFFLHLQSLSAIILSFKLQYPRKNSSDRSPCISLKNSLRDLIKDQRTLCLAIIFFIHWTPRIRFTPNLLSAYRVQKVQTTVKSRAKKVNTAFALEFTSYVNWGANAVLTRSLPLTYS